MSKSPAIIMSVDYGQAISAINVIDAAGKALARVSDESSDIFNALLEYHEVLLEGVLDHDAKINSDRMAHVYQWSDVVDRTGVPKSFYTSNGDLNDSANNFRATPIKGSPLFYMKRTGKKSVSQVYFLDNPNPALIDSSVEESAMGDLGDHHFKDQAVQLEKVARIVKSSSNVSKRRVAGSLGTGERRIIQGIGLASAESGTGIINVKNYTRNNPYHKQFEKFWMNFIKRNSGQMPKKVMVAAAKALFEATSTMQKRRAALAISGSQGASLFGSQFTMGRVTAGGIQLQFLDNGRLITKWPEADQNTIRSIEIIVANRIRKESKDNKISEGEMRSGGRARNREIIKKRPKTPSKPRTTNRGMRKITMRSRQQTGSRVRAQSGDRIVTSYNSYEV